VEENVESADIEHFFDWSAENGKLSGEDAKELRKVL